MFFWNSLAFSMIQQMSVMSNSVRPHRQQPTSFLRPWDSPGKNIGVGCHFLLQCMKGKVKVKSLSPVRLCAIPWTAAYQAPLSMGVSRQEYWKETAISYQISRLFLNHETVEPCCHIFADAFLLLGRTSAARSSPFPVLHQ